MEWVWNLWRANAPLTLASILTVAGLGVPSPASLAIVATGAFVRQGGASLPLTTGLAILGSVLGSFASYEIARRGLGRWLEKKRRKPAWAKAVGRFERDAWTTIFLSRWLLTPLGLPVSYLAGGSRYSRTKYLTAATAGSALWVGIYGGIGYAFADQWRVAAGKAKGYELWIGAGVAVTALGAFLAARYKTKRLS